MAAAPQSLLASAPEEGARRVALVFLGEARAAAERLAGEGDDTALHDLRVALRKLRTVMRAFRGELRRSIPRKRREQLRELASATGEGRDAEVQLAWARALLDDPSPSARAGAWWLASALTDRKTRAYEDLRERIVPALLGLVPRLEDDLVHYRVQRRVFEADSGDTFGARMAERLRAHADALVGTLREVHGPADEAIAHEGRIHGKRVRYLLASIDGEVPEVQPAVKTLKGLQELLGDLNDLAVRTASLGREIEAAAIDRARRLASAVAAHEGVTEHAGEEQAGLLELLRRAHLDKRTTFARLEEEWLRSDALDRLRDVIEAVAVHVAPRGHAVEIERKYLLKSVPPAVKSARSALLEQGYVPGEQIHERVRRKRVGRTEERFRTVKLGSGVTRIEIEEPLSRSLFAKLWPLTEGRRVRKRRYEIEDGALTWEIDVFLDRELVLAEVELPREDMRPPFPDWLAPYVEREVTDDSAYVNLNLAK